MKQISIFLAGLLLAFSVHARNNITASAVTITVNGNKNLQLTVDERDYTLTNNMATGNKTTVSLTNLQAGQHTFLVTRTGQNTNRSDRIATTFNLRYGYDMLITINGNGSIELIETKKIGISDNQAPMNNANYNTLLQNVKNQRSAAGRRSLLTNAFRNTNNYFSTYQVVQLLQLVNAENFRLQLAKLSYRSITDRSNFDQVYGLLNSPASEAELDAYVNNYNEDENLNPAMPDASFTGLYQTIQQQWPVSTQMNSLTNAFNSSSNYFSTYQARQLIQLVNAENNRLQLAKLSYRSITDPSNFSQVFNLLNSQASKDELAAYINNYSNNNSNVAMSAASFTTLYQTIQQQWPVNVQMNSLNNTFNNKSYFFTTYQARQLIQIVSDESNRLQLAKLSYRSITDPVNFNQVYELLNSQASKNELTNYISNYTGYNPNVPMADANFNNLYQTIQQQWPVTTQMNSLTSAFNNNNNYFTAYQITRLIRLVNAENNRLQLAKFSYHTITDRDNFFQVYDLLGSEASKNELTNYISNHTGTNTNAPMPDANFTTLYQTIQSQFFPNEKMSSLTDEFNNTSNYFSTAQAKQLIQLVSFESNRLQLAKLSYRTITDRDNFSQLYDILSSQASRNELDAYVKAYKE